jgi:hypothetical protein
MSRISHKERERIKTVASKMTVVTGEAKAHSLHRLVKRQCVICGARVRNQNPKTTTCDETCTAARNAGRTRLEQIRWELANPNVDENPPCCETCGMFTSQCQCWDAVNGI